MQGFFKYSLLSSALLLGLSACGGGGGGEGYTSPVVNAPSSEMCPSNMSCDFLTVPRDYQDESAGTVEVYYGIHHATDIANRIGTLFVNYGGPGGEAVSSTSWFVQDGLPQEILQRFDIVALDPRGSGQSSFATELTQCGQAILDDVSCSVSLPKIASDIGTNNIARDIEQLRAHLGEESISFLGYSYGTRLASVYSNLYPERVRALVLDSPMSPSVTQNSLLSLSEVPAFDTIGKYRLETPERYQRVIELVKHFDSFDNYYAGDGVFFSWYEMIDVLYISLSLESIGDWKIIKEGVFELLDNNNGALLEAQLEQLPYIPLTAEDMRFSLMFRSVMCADEMEALSFNDVESLYSDFVTASPIYGNIGFSNAHMCSYWEGQRDPIVNIENMEQVLNGQQVLLIAGELDPRTPYYWGTEMAQAFGDSAGLITVTNTVEHGFSYRGIACVDDVTTAYLIDPSQPLSDAECPGDILGRSMSTNAINHPIDKINELTQQVRQERK